MDRHVCLSGKVEIVEGGPPTTVLAMVKASWKDIEEVRLSSYIDELKIPVTHFSNDNSLTNFKEASILIDGVISAELENDEIVIKYMGDDKEILTKLGEIL